MKRRKKRKERMKNCVWIGVGLLSVILLMISLGLY